MLISFYVCLLIVNICTSFQTKVISKLLVEDIFASHSSTFEEEETENKDIFASDKEIFFKVEMKSGNPDVYYLGIDGNNETSNSLPMSYVLPMVRLEKIIKTTILLISLSLA